MNAGHVSGAIDLPDTSNGFQVNTNVFSGNLIDSHNNACNFAKKTAMAEVTQPYDLVITSNSGYPLDQNLYQTVKGLSAASQIVKNKGEILYTSRWRYFLSKYHFYHI